MKLRALRSKIYRCGVLILLICSFTMMIACKSKEISVADKAEIINTVSKEGTIVNDRDGVRVTEDAEVSKIPDESKNTNSGQTDKELAKKEADIDKKAMLKEYKSILEGVYYNHTFPDGQACEWYDDTDLSQNMYAVYDIDLDNKDELILEYSTACMAGMIELIYGYITETNKITEELRIFPNATHYDNGIIKAGWSHNQGMAGDFWPYTLYQYNMQSDQYDNVGMVDAWDRKVAETNYEYGKFPSDYDTDKDGIVYYIMPDENYELKNPVDGPEYQKWIDSYVGNADELNIPFSNMTEDNIAKIDDDTKE